jgi:hypothetical protein
MRLFSTRHPRRALLGAALAAGLLAVNTADAAVACRADPVVTLSNGITVDLHVTANDTRSDLQHVSYVLHGPPLPAAPGAPAGFVGSGRGWYTVIYPDGTGAISSFQYVPDDNVGNYDAHITVTTVTPNVSMTGYMDWAVGTGTPTPTAPAQGHSGQALHIHMDVA